MNDLANQRHHKVKTCDVNAMVGRRLNGTFSGTFHLLKGLKVHHHNTIQQKLVWGHILLIVPNILSWFVFKHLGIESCFSMCNWYPGMFHQTQSRTYHTTDLQNTAAKHYQNLPRRLMEDIKGSGKAILRQRLWVIWAEFSKNQVEQKFGEQAWPLTCTYQAMQACHSPSLQFDQIPLSVFNLKDLSILAFMGSINFWWTKNNVPQGQAITSRELQTWNGLKDQEDEEKNRFVNSESNPFSHRSLKHA